ncbi:MULTISPECIES: hypothetical protein [Enterococcus]|uniref:hypothetical protein n=1 Tax=Enterococcus faecium TaxID=1352 RepID=UPI0017AE8146|nr:hypothetical protein [Enterococcus faecium]MDN6917383.1 hypothetical protein [Enterococcus faecium]NVD31931.1 hypothetical protein [Enterococcus faecium]HBL3196551.1 hypothetical protein [Enterococcus faecium]HBM7175149.1 hypothetical protein [Enterococcus faecium]
MDQIYKDLIEAGWTMRDVDEADYHYLLHLFGEVESGDDEYVDAHDFIKRFLSPGDLKKIEERR